MRIAPSARIALTLALALSLAGCGKESRVYPWNWFKGSQEVKTLDPKEGYPKIADDPRLPVTQVTRLEVKQTLGGAIVSAAGMPPTQGWWSAELVAENDGKPVEGVITYHFLLEPPPQDSAAAQRVSTPESREVTVAAFVPNPRLDETHKIVVIGAENTRSVSR